MNTTIHVIIADYGKLGQAVAERDSNDTDLEGTIRDLMSGQIDKPIRVYAFNAQEGWASDVSEDIAREIAARREPLPAAVVEFIALHAGEQLANQFRSAA